MNGQSLNARTDTMMLTGGMRPIKGFLIRNTQVPLPVIGYGFAWAGHIF